MSLAAAVPAIAAGPTGHFTLRQVLGYPFPTDLTSAAATGEIAWQLNERGNRNIWVADAPDFKPRQITHYRGDNGQELTSIQLSADGKYMVYVRGGDHDNIYSVEAPPDPLATIGKEKVQVWAVPTSGGAPVLIGEGDSPLVAPDSRHVVFIHHGDHDVWTAAIDGSGKAHRLFFDNGRAHDLHWSPDGKQLAFVSSRDDHSFIGIYTTGEDRIRYIDPTTNRDIDPHWSPDGKRIAFVRRPGRGGQLAPLLKRTPQPWAIWIADVATGKAHVLWQSPHTLEGSMPDTAGGTNLHWAAGNRLVFVSDIDGWPHLYSIPAQGGEPQRLTSGHYMVEDVRMSSDRRFVIYSANTGDTPHDIDRRHLFEVSVEGGTPRALTAGRQLEWSPVALHGGHALAFIRAGAKTPPLIAVMPVSGGSAKILNQNRIPDDFPTDSLVVPKWVTFKAGDGYVAYGQLFERADTGAGKKPAVIFVHGGPMRQMLLGWHYSGYYSNAYAVNQYLANQGYVVLSVNYRLGIGHGWQFHHPAHAGPAGASEYGDVLAGAHYLQQLPGVDGTRIGIWGGSYGGYLTALSLARDSGIFKVGSDWAGIHDWALDMSRNWFHQRYPDFESGDRAEALKIAWQSSPVASIDKWRSPVLLVQGDKDHTVRFHQTVDLADRLGARHVPFKELVIPNEIHTFLRYHSWYKADAATADFFNRYLHGKP